MGYYELLPPDIRAASADVMNLLAPHLDPDIPEDAFFALEKRILFIMAGVRRGNYEKDRDMLTPSGVLELRFTDGPDDDATGKGHRPLLSRKT